ncbi:DUF1716 domain containing protein [Niveomyces insectorum RCEF 264]|uniref:DUF1716 domain containing protein n=1 Tax=Niveomyces insectorum RCEF 264 TaxID=1081102 RepID=A0A167YT51_9HYPO|nr:DUF1716 domain containing protein [Niveomyces insectorum RCEF 264]
MTSIDDLFKQSGVPSKRKPEPLRDPNQAYKSVRLSANGSSARRARVEEDDDNDVEAGPARPPSNGQNDGDDGDYGPAPPPDYEDEEEEDAGDDEEGRFFGGGISKAEASVLKYVEGQDAGSSGGSGGARRTDAAEGPTNETYDAAWLRRTALNFEKRINRNAELRARYETEPTRFIGSEADLDADIKALSILGEHPALYPECARLGTVASLVGLLAHDNTDIAISAIEIIGELTDEDVDATDDQWTALVDALLDADLVGLLVSNLGRLDEDADEADRTGVYYALGIVENLCASQSSTRAAEALGGHDGLVRWLLQRVQRAEPAVTQNKQYAAEILAILAQASAANRARMVDELNTIDTLLQLVAAYRRRDPEKGGLEEEYMENLFEALTYLVDDDDVGVETDAGRDGDKKTKKGRDTEIDGGVAPSLGKAKFVEAEGVELCLLMLKEGKKSRAPALRLLDHAVSGIAAGDVCRRVVDAGGLKPTFTLFMRGDENTKKHKNKKHDKTQQQRLHAGATAEHLVAVFASMLRLLPAEAPERIRLLAKFVERDYEKVDQLVALRREYDARVAVVDREMEDEGRGRTYAAALADGDGDGGDNDEKAALAAERLARRLEAGLFTLQNVDIILAWLVAEDDGARRKIQAVLADRDETFAVLRQSLQERRDELDLNVIEGRDMRDVLTALMEFLQ